jgi:hypothetical protein
MSSSENSNYDSDNDSSPNDSPQVLHLQNNEIPQSKSNDNNPLTKSDEIQEPIPAERQGKAGPIRIPINAFSLFKEEHFENIKRENPQLTHMELIDLIAQKWGENDKAVRDEYQRKYLERKQNFPKFSPVKITSTSVNEPSILNWSIKKSTPLPKRVEKVETPQQQPPKKPTTAFFQFKAEQYAEVKAQNPDALETELTSKIAEKWRNMDEKQKGLYENQFVEAKEKYEKELKDFQNLAPSQQQSNKKRNWTEEKTPKAEQDSEQTPKKPSTIKKTLSRLGSFLSYFGLSDSK